MNSVCKCKDNDDVLALIEQKVTELLAARTCCKAGQLVYLSGAKLYDNCAWADGSIAYFSEYPELEEAWVQGYIATLTEDATEEEKTNNPFKWIETKGGLYLPRLGGLFPRMWTPEQIRDSKRELGSLQKATGIAWWTGSSRAGALAVGQSHLPEHKADELIPEKGGAGASAIAGQVSAVNDIGYAVTTRPVNYAQPVAVYLGKRVK